MWWTTYSYKLEIKRLDNAQVFQWELTVCLYYEYNFMRGLIMTNMNLAKRFSTTVRYIDDLLTLNNTKFQEEITNIYPNLEED